MTATGQIGFWTVVPLCGQVLPLVVAPLTPGPFEPVWLAFGALWCVPNTRFAVQRRFRTHPIGLPLHTVAITLLLAVQWYAVLRRLVGKPVGWKGRDLPTAPS